MVGRDGMVEGSALRAVTETASVLLIILGANVTNVITNGSGSGAYKNRNCRGAD